MSLYCLVYTSVASRDMSDDELKALLQKSRIKNQKLNITGMLLHLEPFFIQVLEGEEATVTEAFNRIKADSRHQKVSLIYKKKIQSRTFPDWTMGFNRIGSDDLEGLDGFADYLNQPVPKSIKGTAGEIERLLGMFKNESLF